MKACSGRLSGSALIEPFAGASGNMLIGAFLDLKPDLAPLLEAQLNRFPLSGWHLRVEKVSKCYLMATWADFVVDQHSQTDHRHLSDIQQLIDQSDLLNEVKQDCQRVFQRLGQAEAKVHGCSLEDVHFHEVGAVDSILDIVGVCWLRHHLGLRSLFCAAMPLPSGAIYCEHGQFPNPGPATLELMLGSPTRPVQFDREMVTPTGAALLTTLCSFELPKFFIPFQIGYGSGTSDFPFPNVLRLQLGQCDVGPVD